MIKKRQNEDKEAKKILYHNGKKLYERPQVKEYGSIEKLTQSGGSGATETSGRRRHGQ